MSYEEDMNARRRDAGTPREFSKSVFKAVMIDYWNKDVLLCTEFPLDVITHFVRQQWVVVCRERAV
jgi:hypothetical protein